MSREKVLKDAVALAARGVLLVATSGKEGVPHVAAANAITLVGAGKIAVTDWFCPGTVANAAPGRPVSIVVWNPADDTGHQIIGRVASVEEIAMLDGYVPGEDDIPALPQEERRLVIEVDTVLSFRRAPHSDIEE